MNYLDITNQVLLRLREDPITTVLGQLDPVVQIVISHVNDAKRLVEDAHTWNSQRYEWTVTTVAGQDTYSMVDSGNYARIEYIYGSDASQPREAKLVDIKRRKAQGPATAPRFSTRPTAWTPTATSSWSSTLPRSRTASSTPSAATSGSPIWWRTATSCGYPPSP